MWINTKNKYCFIRNGHKFNKPCCCITTSAGNAIAWSNSCKYLGMYLLAGRKFRCNFHEAKAKYYRAFNGIIGKVGRSASQKVIIELVRMKCLPFLLYVTEAWPLANKDISSMEHFLNYRFSKIFIVKKQEIISECRKAFNFDNLNQFIKNRQLIFIAKLPITNNRTCRLISYIESLYYFYYWLLFSHVIVLQF